MRYTLALLLLVSPASPAEPAREVGSLVFDGIPLVDAAVMARGVPYANIRSARLAAWDPAGEGMYIVTRFGETAQVHHVAAPGADRQQLTFFGEPVGDTAPDPAQPNGLYVSVDRGGGEDFQLGWLDRTRNVVTWLTAEGSRNTGMRVAVGGDHLLFTGTERNGTDFDLYQVDRHDPATRRRLIELEGDWGVADWSDDARTVILAHFVSATASTLHRFDVATGRLDRIGAASADVSVRGGLLARDGASVFYTSDEGGEFRTLRRMDLTTGRVEPLTPGVRWDVEELVLSPDRRWLAWTVNAGGASEVYLADSTGRTPARRITGLPQGVAAGLAFDPTGSRLGVSLSTASSPSDVYAVDVRHPDRATRWTRSELGGLDPSRFVQPQLVDFPSFDGVRVPAWYYPAPGKYFCADLASFFKI